jgi:hypothetical protein
MRNETVSSIFARIQRFCEGYCIFIEEFSTLTQLKQIAHIWERNQPFDTAATMPMLHDKQKDLLTLILLMWRIG